MNQRKNSQNKKARSRKGARQPEKMAPQVRFYNSPTQRTAMVVPSRPKMETLDGGITRIRGFEKWVSLAPTTTAAGGLVTFNPASSYFGWLAGLANHFSEYRVRNLKIEYVSQVPTTVGGVLTVCWFGDVSDGLQWFGQGNDSQLAVGFKAKVLPVWQSTTLMTLSSRDIRANSPWFKVGSNTASTSSTVPGALAYYYGYSTAPASNTTPGLIYITYDLEFVQTTSPQYNVSSNPVPNVYRPVYDWPDRLPPDDPSAVSRSIAPSSSCVNIVEPPLDKIAELPA